MQALGNQYSFVLFSLAALVGVIALLRWRRASWRVTAAAALVVVLLAGGIWLVLRPGTSDIDSVEAAQAIIESGTPTLVEFYSNYCASCLAARPQVDALMGEIKAQGANAINVLQIDIHTDAGRELRELYGFTFSPEFVLFNAAGEAVWRSHAVPSHAEIESIMDAI